MYLQHVLSQAQLVAEWSRKIWLRNTKLRRVPVKVPRSIRPADRDSHRGPLPVDKVAGTARGETNRATPEPASAAVTSQLQRGEKRRVRPRRGCFYHPARSLCRLRTRQRSYGNVIAQHRYRSNGLRRPPMLLFADHLPYLLEKVGRFASARLAKLLIAEVAGGEDGINEVGHGGPSSIDTNILLLVGR